MYSRFQTHLSLLLYGLFLPQASSVPEANALDIFYQTLCIGREGLLTCVGQTSFIICGKTSLMQMAVNMICKDNQFIAVDPTATANTVIPIPFTPNPPRALSSTNSISPTTTPIASNPNLTGPPIISSSQSQSQPQPVVTCCTNTTPLTLSEASLLPTARSISTALSSATLRPSSTFPSQVTLLTTHLVTTTLPTSPRSTSYTTLVVTPKPVTASPPAPTNTNTLYDTKGGIKNGQKFDCTGHGIRLNLLNDNYFYCISHGSYVYCSNSPQPVYEAPVDKECDMKNNVLTPKPATKSLSAQTVATSQGKSKTSSGSLDTAIGIFQAKVKSKH